MTPVALHHVAAGPPDGPPVVLGSSLGTTHTMWVAQSRALARRHRVIAFDHRGHGGSPAPPGPYALDELGADVLALLDRLGLPRVSWCGLSLGGMIGLWLAAHAPERIERLVVVCSSAHLPPASGWHERAAAVRAARSVDVVADAVVARWLTPAWAAAHPAERDDLRAMLAATPPEGYASCCEAIAAMDLRPALGRIAAPTLLVAGEEDQATPPAHAETMAAGIARARLVRLSPAAHLAAVERAADVTALITTHLEAP